jgi:hypothetical protein
MFKDDSEEMNVSDKQIENFQVNSQNLKLTGTKAFEFKGEFKYRTVQSQF